MTDKTSSTTGKKYHAVVIVLGDIGRSPRMQYHTRSLLESGFNVTLIGYTGEELIPELVDESNRNLNVIRFEPSLTLPSSLRTSCKPLYFLLRLIGLVSGVLYTLWSVNREVHCILVQNPPSIPLLLLSYIYSCWKHAVWIIDWHNLGFTMYDLPTGHPICKITKCYEKMLARRADAHICVTNAMKRWLLRHEFVVLEDSIRVLHDRPPEFFRKTPVEEIHDLMLRLGFIPNDDKPETTLFTQKLDSGEIVLRKDRPALLISSTSWTPDEDFSILLSALIRLDEMAVRHNNNQNKQTNTADKSFPNVIVVVTGKGPQKRMYEQKIAEIQLTHIYIQTIWLEASDYPPFIGCADLGISLHTSTSGVDFPMKVLDCFGAQVPVCAIHFDSLSELVQDKVNGRVFRNSEDLCELLFGLLLPFRDDDCELKHLQKGICGMSRWRENWDMVVKDWTMDLCASSEKTRERDRLVFMICVAVLVILLAFAVQKLYPMALKYGSA